MTRWFSRAEACGSRLILLFVLAVAATACDSRLAAQTTQPAAADHAGLMDRLRAAGASVEVAGEVEQPFLSVTGAMIKVGGEDVQVFQYSSAAEVEAQAALVSPDGGAVGTSKPHWVGPPHFYKKGRLLVLYVGDDDKVLMALDAALGRQFAGR